MIEMGLIVGIALLITMSKMDWRWKLRVLSNPLLIDAIVFAMLIVIHWGTFSGVMVATIGAATCSLILSAGRWLIGHTQSGIYVPGKISIAHKLA